MSKSSWAANEQKPKATIKNEKLCKEKKKAATTTTTANSGNYCNWQSEILVEWKKS